MEGIASKRLSCGIVILNEEHEVLLCHVTGRGHWDLPKGGIDPGESPMQAALRETREETGLVLDGDDLLDLGRIHYGERKDLHLFAVRMARFDTAQLSCESEFSERWSGKRLPEMDGYGWFAFERAGALCAPKMGRVLSETIDLAMVLSRLEHTATAPVALMTQALHSLPAAVPASEPPLHP
jgi:8-oxo-dGTP pyrophosphatase MutT (NUDIX family)